MIYDRFAHKYDGLLAPFERRFLANWRREILSYLPKNARVLEIGAGTGGNFKCYPQFDKAVATEISIKMLKIAKEKSNAIELIQSDAEKLPFSDCSFDAAFATLVFCSIENPEKAFSELKRVLNANDRIVLLEHVRPDGLLGYLFDVINVFIVALAADHFNRNTRLIAEASGLRIVKVVQKMYGVVNLIVCEVKK